MNKEILKRKTVLIWIQLIFIEVCVPVTVSLQWYERENEQELLNQLTKILEDDDENN